MPGIRGIGPKGSHQAAGSCHKDPSGASTRAGLEGAKIGKNRRGTPASRFNRGNSGPIRLPTAPSRRIMAEIALPHAHGRLRAAATSQHRRLQPGEAKHTMFRQGGAASPANPVSIKGSLDGLAMKDDQGKGTEKTGADVKDSRRDRLKLALRENLKRRKSQAKGRSDVDASSESIDALLDDASGEKPDS